MQQILKQQLYQHICAYHPELILELKEDFSIHHYLDKKIDTVNPFLQELMQQGKPAYIIQDLCLQEMIRELGPSRYVIIRDLLEEEFTGDYLMMKENGSLTMEAFNIMQRCHDTFETFGFQENRAENRLLTYALIEEIHSYLLTN